MMERKWTDRWRLARWWLAAMIAYAPWAGFAPAAAQENAPLTGAAPASICADRPGCTLSAEWDAGADESGNPVRLIRVTVGPDDSTFIPIQICDAETARGENRIEYWVLHDQEAQPIFAVCESESLTWDDDALRIGNNELTLYYADGDIETGQRSQSTTTYRLAPLAQLREELCWFSERRPDRSIAIDYQSLQAREIIADPAWPGWATDATRYQTCPFSPRDIGQGQVFSARPRDGYLAAYPLPMVPVESGENTLSEGQGLGDCALRLTTDGKNGFLVHGTQAPQSDAAELRVSLFYGRVMVLQVMDPLAMTELHRPRDKSSWVDLPHIELWLGDGDGGATHQLGLGWDGSLHDGVRAPQERPSVQTWDGMDEKARPVRVFQLTWPPAPYFEGGMAVVYSQAQNGGQARLIASTGIESNQPLYLPPAMNFGADTGGEGIAGATGCAFQQKHLRIVPRG